MVTVALNSQECPQTQFNVILPRSATATLRPFDQTKLLDAAMKLLDLPTERGVFDALQIAHLNLIRRPVLRVAVPVNQTKHLDLSKSLESHHTPAFIDLEFGNRF